MAQIAIPRNAGWSTGHIGSLFRRRAAAQSFLALALAGLIALALAPVLTAPAAVPSTAAATEFSAERALRHVAVIAREPHPMGSPEHAAARDYIVGQLRALGLDPEVQVSSIARTDPEAQAGTNAVSAARVENIVARLPGTANSGAVLLIGNYDSMPTTPGAADPVASGAALLETLRAIRSGPPFKNDLIAAFIDVEPSGLMGDRAFAAEHRWGRDAAIAFAFPTLGVRGPIALEYASSPNGWLMAEALAVIPHPVVYSALSSLLEPAGGVFLHEEILHGAAGLEFVGFNEPQRYHTMGNSIETLDPRLLQHQGGTMLALARRFGDHNLPAGRGSGPNSVFFTIAPGQVISYPAPWALPIAGLAGIGLLATLAIGLRRRALTARGLLGATALAPVLSATLIAIVAGGWWALKALHPNHQVTLVGMAYNADVYLVGLALVAAGAAGILVGWLHRRLPSETLAAGALLWFGVLALLSSLVLPGASYLFTWPLVAGLLLLGWLILVPDRAARPWPRALALALTAFPAIVLWLPLAPIIFAPLGQIGAFTGLAIGGLALLPLVFALGALLPQIAFLSGAGDQRSKGDPAAPGTLTPTLSPAGEREPGDQPVAPTAIPPAASQRSTFNVQPSTPLPPSAFRLPSSIGLVLAGLGLIAVGALTSRFDATNPRPNSIAYELDRDTGQARWISGDVALDPWTRQFFPNGAEPATFVPLPDQMPDHQVPGWQAPAPAVPLAAPEVQVIQDEVRDGSRTLRLRLTSPRGAPHLIVDLQAAGDLAVRLDGKPIEWGQIGAGQRDHLHLAYQALPAEGIVLDIIAPAGPLTVHLEDRSNGLPVVPGFTIESRPADTMPAISLMRDPTIVKRTVTLDPVR